MIKAPDVILSGAILLSSIYGIHTKFCILSALVMFYEFTVVFPLRNRNSHIVSGTMLPDKEIKIADNLTLG